MLEAVPTGVGDTEPRATVAPGEGETVVVGFAPGGNADASGVGVGDAPTDAVGVGDAVGSGVGTTGDGSVETTGVGDGVSTGGGV